MHMKSYRNFSLKSYNSYRVSAHCERAFFPENEEDVVNIFKEYPNPVLIGSGHNIILSKEYYDNAFMIFNGNFNAVNVDAENNIIEAEAGISMLEISQIACENSMTGLEVFYDIPSSLGGAVVMNAGASGEEIKDVLIKVRFLDLDDFKIKEKDASELNFEYRNSFFQKSKNKIVLKSWLQLVEGNKEDIRDKMESIKEKRWAKQPKEYPNAGSVFKRPEGRFVGPMLDELSLKGFTIGGAQVSKKHSGFIVNHDDATGQDILNLIKEIQIKVKNRFDVDLEVEQRII